MRITTKSFLIAVCVPGVLLLATSLFLLIANDAENGKFVLFACVFCSVIALIMLLYWIPAYRMRRDMESSLQENLLRSGLASCFIKFKETAGMLATLAPKSGGVLVLTADEIVFKSCRPLERKYSVTIPLEDCIEISAVDFFGSIRTGLRIERKNGTMEQFIISHRNVWLETIRRAIAEKMVKQDQTRC